MKRFSPVMCRKFKTAWEGGDKRGRKFRRAWESVDMRGKQLKWKDSWGLDVSVKIAAASDATDDDKRRFELIVKPRGVALSIVVVDRDHAKYTWGDDSALELDISVLGGEELQILKRIAKEVLEAIENAEETEDADKDS